jgi:hypothetical protein
MSNGGFHELTTLTGFIDYLENISCRFYRELNTFSNLSAQSNLYHSPFKRLITFFTHFKNIVYEKNS